MFDRNKSSIPGERILYKTRPRFVVSLKSAIIKFIIVMLLVYFFTTLIKYAAMVQGRVGAFVNIPFVEGTTDLIVIIILILLIWILWNYLSWKSTYYTLTNQRVMIKSGVIRKKSAYMHYNKIQDIVVSQSLMERLSYSGDIEVFGGHDNTSIILEDIPNPGEVEDMINRMIAGDEPEFEPKTPKTPKKPEQPKKTGRSIMEEYDKKFKL